MALLIMQKPEPIIECVPYDKDIPSISKLAGRGYVHLHALYDTWIFPWKYKKVELNISKIYLPDNCFGIISTMEQILYPNLVEVKTQVVPMKEFPNGIKIRNGYGFMPFKIHAGDKIAILHMVPFVDVHTIELKEQKSYIGG